MTTFYILAGLGGLGLMILIHEWGHFVAARFFGVRVKTFAIGFGPRLFGVKRGSTDYCVRAFPLGGYVKMAGDNFMEEREGAPDEFFSKPRWQRSIIALAGPAVNIVAAVLILFVLYQFSYQKLLFLEEPAEIYAIVPDSPAEKVGLLPGDRIVRVGGTQDPDWESTFVETVLAGKVPLEIVAERGDERLQFSIPLEMRKEPENPFEIGWLPYSPIVVTAVEDGMPAAEAGLLPGDELSEIDGQSTTELGAPGFIDAIQAKAGAPVELGVHRKGETFTVELAAVKRDRDGDERYYLGIGIGPRMVNRPLSMSEAFPQAVKDNVKFVQQMGMLFSRLVGGSASMSALQGPIGIVGLLGQAAEIGLSSLIRLLALISMNLGVLNLLPIPVLDGGHIATFAVEGILRRDLSLRVKERFLQFGVLALMLLFAVVMYNDIMRYFIR